MGNSNRFVSISTQCVTLPRSQSGCSISAPVQWLALVFLLTSAVLTEAAWGMDKYLVLLQSISPTRGLSRATHVMKAIWETDMNNTH